MILSQFRWWLYNYPSSSEHTCWGRAICSPQPPLAQVRDIWLEWSSRLLGGLGLLVLFWTNTMCPWILTASVPSPIPPYVVGIIKNCVLLMFLLSCSLSLPPNTLCPYQSWWLSWRLQWFPCREWSSLFSTPDSSLQHFPEISSVPNLIRSRSTK